MTAAPDSLGVVILVLVLAGCISYPGHLLSPGDEEGVSNSAAERRSPRNLGNMARAVSGEEKARV